jgi:predicted aconitase
MRLREEERAWLAAEAGPARQWAIEHQLRLGSSFGAADLVPVEQARTMAHTEWLGAAGVARLARVATLPATATARSLAKSDPGHDPPLPRISGDTP